MIVSVIIIILLVQSIQYLGNKLSNVINKKIRGEIILKKCILILLTIVLSFTILTSCGSKQEDEKSIKIGVSPEPPMGI